MVRGGGRRRRRTSPSPDVAAHLNSRGPITAESLAGIHAECVGISDFLSRFVVEDGDDVIVEGLQLSLQDIDDPDRLVHFVRFRCGEPEELGRHLEELRLGNPYTRKLVRDVRFFSPAVFWQCWRAGIY
jgi:hypothetical protein